MKNLFISFSVLCALIFVSCERSTNYSAQLEQERKKIKEYLAKNGYTVVNLSDSAQKANVCNNVTPSNTYYCLGEDSIYFRLDSVGAGKKVELGNLLQIRYVESTLDERPVVESYWTTMDLPYPVQIILGNLTYNCVGWQSAVRLMGYSDAIAEFIVPSKIGLEKALNPVVPYHYKFTFKILPK
ncbi:MAG: DUF4827 domain-containing protein [Prevotellaceae bacterium]|jgi:hypothetical protein|nr:DUF4827 domain-containing protein [Prevotellaceae bacterium]